MLNENVLVFNQSEAFNFLVFIVKCYNGLACINNNRLIKINDYFTRIDYKSLQCFNKNTQCQQYLTTINGTLYYILNFFCKFHFPLLPPTSLMLSNCSPIPGNIVWGEKGAFKFLFFRWITWFLLIGGLSDTDKWVLGEGVGIRRRANYFSHLL